MLGPDTRRLSIYKVKGGADEKISLIVPRKSTMEILKLFKDETFDTLCDETDIILKREGILLFSRLINGDYPDYNRVHTQREVLTFFHFGGLPKKKEVYWEGGLERNWGKGLRPIPSFQRRVGKD